jgi:bacterioferritin-associated ferredoxin
VPFGELGSHESGMISVRFLLLRPCFNSCILVPVIESAAVSRQPRFQHLRRAESRRMTRCECTGIDFREIARALSESGQGLDDVSSQTGCGQICTACLPDLRTFLSESFSKPVNG